MSDRRSRVHRPVFSEVLPSGGLVEAIHDARDRRTALLVGQEASVTEVREVKLGEEEVLVPYSPQNNLLVHRAVLLASGSEPPGETGDLLSDIELFIERYVALSDERRTIAATFVLLTWVYDRFNEVPYLRVRGDYGSGKSRFLAVIGSIVYKGIFASGASTVSPLFRLLDSVAGTLIVDEGDFRFSDEKAELIKILNNGNARGFPVFRTEVSPRKEFNPTAFSVFGPKVIATRGAFDDKALESRCITFEMSGTPHLSSIPISLPERFEDEARALRNRLLGFRFRSWGTIESGVMDALQLLEPRIRQILTPLYRVAPCDKSRSAVAQLALELQGRVWSERSERPEAILAQLLAAIDLHESVSVGRLARMYGDVAEEREAASPRWIGYLLRERLGIRTVKQHGVFVIARGQEAQISSLRERFGIGDRGTSGTSGMSSGESEPLPRSS